MHESDPELTLALRNSLNRLKLAEDYCDMFDRLVDMSDIAQLRRRPAANAGIARRRRPGHGLQPVADLSGGDGLRLHQRDRAAADPGPLAGLRARRTPMRSAPPATAWPTPWAAGTPTTCCPAAAARPARRCCDDCRKVLEDFRKRNKWSKRQKETVRRLDRDGERFLRLFVDEARGELNVRFVEPLEIQNPPDKTSADGVYFGIQFARIGEAVDIETPVGYFLVNIGTLGESIGLRETVPAEEMQHLKANVDMTWPRGLPTWYALQGHLNDAVKTLKATGKIVEFRARIGMIRRHINGTKEAVQRIVERGRPAATSRPAGTRPHRIPMPRSSTAATPPSTSSPAGRPPSTRTWPPSRPSCGPGRRPWRCRSTCSPATPRTRTSPARWWPKARP